MLKSILSAPSAASTSFHGLRRARSLRLTRMMESIDAPHLVSPPRHHRHTQRQPEPPGTEGVLG